MDAPLVSMCTYLFNAEQHGFPWRECYSEFLMNGLEVVVVSPECDDNTRDKLIEWSAREPLLQVITHPRLKGSADFATVANLAMDRARGEFTFWNGSDEVLEVSQPGLFLERLRRERPALLASKTAISFPRWDFTCSSTWVTPFWSIPYQQARLFATKWRGIRCDPGGDADGVSYWQFKRHWDDCPLFHYHGLGGWTALQRKETAFQELYADRGVRVDPRLKLQATEAWADKIARKFMPDRPHPRVMWPWLARAEMYLRDPLR